AHVLEQGGGARSRFLLRCRVLLGEHFGDVRPEPPHLGEDLVPRLRVGTERPVAVGLLLDEFGGLFDSEFIRGDIHGHGGPFEFAVIDGRLDVVSVAADAPGYAADAVYSNDILWLTDAGYL